MMGACAVILERRSGVLFFTVLLSVAAEDILSPLLALVEGVVIALMTMLDSNGCRGRPSSGAQGVVVGKEKSTDLEVYLAMSRSEHRLRMWAR